MPVQRQQVPPHVINRPSEQPAGDEQLEHGLGQLEDGRQLLEVGLEKAVETLGLEDGLGGAWGDVSLVYGERRLHVETDRLRGLVDAVVDYLLRHPRGEPDA